MPCFCISFGFQNFPLHRLHRSLDDFCRPQPPVTVISSIHIHPPIAPHTPHTLHAHVLACVLACVRACMHACICVQAVASEIGESQHDVDDRCGPRMDTLSSRPNHNWPVAPESSGLQRCFIFGSLAQQLHAKKSLFLPLAVSPQPLGECAPRVTCGSFYWWL